MTAIVVSDVTSYKAAVVIRFIRQHYPNARIVATDHRPLARRIHTRHARDVRILPVTPDAGRPYAEALADVVREVGANVLLPVNSREIRLLMEHRELFGAALAYVGDPALYRQLDDKKEFAVLLAMAGLPCPQDYADLDAPLPLVAKPSRGSSAKGVMYIRTEEERAAAKMSIGETARGHVVQTYVAGEGIGYSGFFQNGQIIAGYAHRRVAEYPVTGGSSVVRERYPYDDTAQLEALVRRVLAAAPWSGFAMFELKRSGSGEFAFIECNPRIWGSIHQGLADGVNFLTPLLGQSVIDGNGRGVRTALSPLDLLALTGYLFRGRFDVLGDVIKGLPRTRLDINPLSDPLGYLALLMRGA